MNALAVVHKDVDIFNTDEEKGCERLGGRDGEEEEEANEQHRAY